MDVKNYESRHAVFVSELKKVTFNAYHRRGITRPSYKGVKRGESAQFTWFDILGLLITMDLNETARIDLSASADISQSITKYIEKEVQENPEWFIRTIKDGLVRYAINYENSPTDWAWQAVDLRDLKHVGVDELQATSSMGILIDVNPHIINLNRRVEEWLTQ